MWRKGQESSLNSSYCHDLIVFQRLISKCQYSHTEYYISHIWNLWRHRHLVCSSGLDNIYFIIGILRWCSGEESACQCRRRKFDPWVWKTPWRRKWQCTPVFLPREFHGQRSSIMGSQRIRHDWATEYARYTRPFSYLLLTLYRVSACFLLRNLEPLPFIL